MSIHRDPADTIDLELGDRIYWFQSLAMANIAKKLWRETAGGNDGLEAALDHHRIAYSVESEDDNN